MDYELEMEEILEDTVSYEYIDFDYEFDAAKFYDFNRLETESEAEEAQRWFDDAGNYPPSPLVMKFNWRPNALYEESDTSSSFSSDGEIDDNNLGLKAYDDDDEAQESTESVAKPSVKQALSKNLSFMNPTASQLAKQNYIPEVQWEQLLRRPERWCQQRQKKCSRRSSVIGAQATKRQKLEAGYLRKGSGLEHHTLYLHKTPKKVGLDFNAAVARPKITIPREPFLATACRAERRRFKTKLESAENTKQGDFTFRARPLNRKILKAPSLPLLKKSTPQMPEFQVFHLRTLERAIQHASVNATNIPNTTCTLQNEVLECRRANSDSVLKEKLEELDKFRGQCIDKDPNFPTNKKDSKEPPIESFSKLSLASENVKSQAKVPLDSKVSKENEPAPPNQETEKTTNAKSQRQGGINYQCGTGQRMHSIGLQINFNRSLDMR